MAPRETASSSETDAETRIELPPRYELVRVIGRGAMGTVVEARDRQLRRRVAVKVLGGRADLEAKRRFLVEAQTAASITHPHVVAVHDVDLDAEIIVMNLVDGETLLERVRRHGPLPPAQVRRLGVQLLDGLAAAHEKGILHRDVKPSNVLIDDQGVKLVDFGIAWWRDSDEADAGVVAGTPPYMAVELLRGQEADERADVYAAGATLFTAATGKPPGDASVEGQRPEEVVFRVTKDRPLANAIGRAMARHRAERFESAESFARALAASRTRTLPYLLVLAVVVLLVVGGLVMLGRGPTDEAEPPAAPAELEVVVFPVDGAQVVHMSESGVARLFEESIVRVAGVKTHNHLAVQQSLRGDGTKAAWFAAANAVGADAAVIAVVERAGGALELSVELVTVEPPGEVLARARTGVSEVADLGATVDAVVTALAGELERDVEPGRASPSSDDLLARALAALSRQDLEEAERAIDTALGQHPESGRANYLAAVTAWWKGDDARARAHVDLALADGVPDAQARFLHGLQAQLDHDHGEAETIFDDAVTAHADDPILWYGLFEARFHHGDGDGAMAAYGEATRRWPQLTLGVAHALSYLAAHGRVTECEAHLRRIPDLAASAHAHWAVWLPLARREYGDALRIEQDLFATASQPTTRRDLALGRLAAFALRGDLGDALTHAEDLRQRLQDPSIKLAAASLLTAVGDPTAAQARDGVFHAIAVLETPNARLRRWAELLALELPLDDRKGLDRIAEALARDDDGSLLWELSGVLVAHAQADTARLRERVGSDYAEVSALARALSAAEGPDADLDWRRAIDGATAVELLPLLRFLYARTLARQGRLVEAADQCEDVVRPPLMGWSWGATVAPCTIAMIEAAVAEGDLERGRGYEQLLRKVRLRAPRGDPWLRRAAAALR